MKAESFAAVARWFRERSGVALGADKLYLVENRLAPVARRHGLADLDALADAVRRGDAALAGPVTDALLAGDTAFFRDLRPFEQFRDEILPKLLAARASTRRLRVWSAGCATGQEAYSLAILLDELGERLAGWTVDLVATDLSEAALERARVGIYSAFEVQRGMPIRTLLRHFAPHGERWQIADALRRRVVFNSFNLLDDPSPLGTFDAVFCRNVLLSFDVPTRGVVLDRIARALAPDGALFLGLAETVLGASDRFAPLPGQRGAYGHAPVPVARAS